MMYTRLLNGVKAIKDSVGEFTRDLAPLFKDASE